jgi:hypothetical protein
MNRRDLLRRALASGAFAALGGCGYFRAESGPAYEPWQSWPDPTLGLAEHAATAGLLAANPHNIQPWLFALFDDGLVLHADPDRSLGAMDPLGRERIIGLGCCVENAVLAARMRGYDTVVDWLPDGEGDTAVAALTFVGADVGPDLLTDAIPLRATHRGRYLDTPLPSGTADALRGSVHHPDVTLHLLEGTAAETLGRATVQATADIVATPEMAEADHRWYRHSEADIAEHRDGVTLDAQQQTAFIEFFGKVGRAPTAESSGPYWIAGTERAVATLSAMGILATPARESAVQQLEVGRTWQRMHLWATAMGLAMQPLNQLAEWQDHEQVHGLPATAEPLFAELMGRDDVGAQMVFRLGIPRQAAVRHSPRRPLSWVTL